MESRESVHVRSPSSMIVGKHDDKEYFGLKLDCRNFSNLSNEYLTNNFEYQHEKLRISFKNDLPYFKNKMLKKDGFVTIIVYGPEYQYVRFVHEFVFKCMFGKIINTINVVIFQTLHGYPKETEILLMMIDSIYSIPEKIGYEDVIILRRDKKAIPIPDLLILISLMNRYNLKLGQVVQYGNTLINLNKVLAFISENALSAENFILGVNHYLLKIEDVEDEKLPELISLFSEKYLKFRKVDEEFVNENSTFYLNSTLNTLFSNLIDKNLDFRINATPYLIAKLIYKKIDVIMNNQKLYSSSDFKKQLKRIFDYHSWADIITQEDVYINDQRIIVSLTKLCEDKDDEDDVTYSLILKLIKDKTFAYIETSFVKILLDKHLISYKYNKNRFVEILGEKYDLSSFKKEKSSSDSSFESEEESVVNDAPKVPSTKKQHKYLLESSEESSSEEDEPVIKKAPKVSPVKIPPLGKKVVLKKLPKK